MSLYLTLNRYSESKENGGSTLGILSDNADFVSYTLEDEERTEKVDGETRIPPGLYELKWRKVESGLTMKYRDKFPEMFKWHIELQNVSGFKYVYIHIGNDDDDTEACILVGDQANNNQLAKGQIWYSTQAFKRLYNKLKPSLDDPSRAVWLRVQDV